MEKTAAALERNNMKCFIAEKKEDVLPIVESLVRDGDTIANGGSVTLAETGVTEFLRSGRFNFLDRAGLDGEKLKKCFRDSFSADVYFLSANAITENGELYNVDGNANRVAALCYGPDSVIVIAGANKLVPDLDAAIRRVKTISAPKNGIRLGLETYCSETGHCVVNCGCNDGEDFCGGCRTDGRMCCSYVVTSYQRNKNRIKVILVGEKLGY